MVINATLSPQGIPVNIFINWDSRNYEILNKTIDTSQTFKIDNRIIEGEYDIIFTNKGEKPVYVEIDIYESISAEKYELHNSYSKIVIPFYYLFFFGGIATIVIGAVLWKKRK